MRSITKKKEETKMKMTEWFWEEKNIGDLKTTSTTATTTKLAFYDQQVKKSSFHDIDRKVKARSQSHKCNIILWTKTTLEKNSERQNIRKKKKPLLWSAYKVVGFLKQIHNAVECFFLLGDVSTPSTPISSISNTFIAISSKRRDKHGAFTIDR